MTKKESQKGLFGKFFGKEDEQSKTDENISKLIEMGFSFEVIS